MAEDDDDPTLPFEDEVERRVAQTRREKPSDDEPERQDDDDRDDPDRNGGDDRGVDDESPMEPSPASAVPWTATAWKWTRRFIIASALLLGVGFVAIALVIRHYEKDLPNTADLIHYEPPQVTRVLAADETLLGELYVERRTVAALAEIPASMKLAALAAEDARFYQHKGLNYLGMLRALAVNLRSASSRQGGSTITQQVVKNVLLTPDRTFERKMREVLLARRIEQELSKDQILELYLNHIYFGHGRYGVEEAARYYFDKSIRDVTLSEAALLAGLPKGPSKYSPRVSPELAERRRQYVLKQMLEKKFANREQVELALADIPELAPEPDRASEIAPEVVSEVRRTLRERVGPEAERGGYTIRTTIRPDLQQLARKAVQDNLDEYAKRHGLLAPFKKQKGDPKPFEGEPDTTGHRIYNAVVVGGDDDAGVVRFKVGKADGELAIKDATRYNPKALPASAFAEEGKVLRASIIAAPADRPLKLRLELAPQAALVALDVRTRDVVAIVGSYEGHRAGLDRATFAHRQPGSTFKAFLYSYAIHSRAFTPASRLVTDPSKIDGYRPDNYDAAEGAKPVLLRDAVQRSINAAAAYTVKEVGPENVAAWAQAAGITSKLGADESIALGAYEVTPRELATAYSTFAAGGVAQPARLITSIVDPGGQQVGLAELPEPHRVMSPAEAYLTTSLLTSVVEGGTGRGAKVLGRPIAGKTGTSNHFKDAWFAGYSTDFVCVSWVGFDDAIPLGRGESGGRAALPAFVSFMQGAHAGKPAADFALPEGIVRVTIDPESGMLAHPDANETRRELFLAGTEPTEEAEEAEEDAAEPDSDGDGDTEGSETPENDQAPPAPSEVAEGSSESEDELPPF